ncbi:MAG: poly(A) polymerase [Deltaproteobacteria bacterium]|jgi:poly(A) polymerase|nr:MAG: poly(A) polymerase [Deltaproteobacteria bacterium]
MLTDPGTASTPVDNTPTPRIIPRSNHPISRKNIDREALKVLYRLRDAGHVAYLVGGGVRDLYLNKTPKDFDISTNARPGQLRKLFKNSRLIGRRFRLVQVFFHGGKIIEVSTFRCRSEFDLNGVDENAKERVLAANNTYGTPSDDAFRRDLTINGLFYEIENHNIIDYTGGVDDLRQGVIRFIGEPGKRVQRDPARMMRVIRHGARNNFAIESSTWQSILDHRDKLKLCPISRIRDELMKDLRSSACRAWTQLAMDSGIFYVLFPFYQTVHEKSENEQNRKLFLDIQGVVDRLHAKGMILPDQLLFSLLLLPWAIAEFDLLNKNYRGPEFNRFLRKIRSRLDELLGPMSIKRAHKESIALHLVNLPQFIRFAKENKWPKWLKRKSYYQECDLVFRIYSEATAGKKIPEHIISKSVQQLTSRKTKPRPSRKGRFKKRGTPGPAFTGKKDGGIFGLKK